MILAGRRFQPAWWSILLTLLGMALFIGLGSWQLHRAEYKQAIQDRFEKQLAEPYQTVSSVADLRDIQYRKLRLFGRYDNVRNLLLDNRLHRGRLGYQVLTPLMLRDSDAVLLVNRGWTPWGETRQQTAPIVQADSDGGVVGIAFYPSEPALELGEFELTGEWPLLIQNIDIEALQPGFDGRLLPWILWLAPETDDAYLRDWQPLWMRPEKSRAYAVQWFAFAVLALVLFIILNLRKVE